MQIEGLIAAGLILFLASMIQSMVGFGYALFATPLLVWIGIPLQNAIVLVAVCALMQSIVGIRKLGAAVPWSLGLIATAIRFLSMLIGVFLLRRLLVLREEQIRIVIGSILCALVAVQVVWRPKPVEMVPKAWTGFAFTLSGLLAGICGMGGPPLVLWSIAHEWPTQKTRGFLFAVFATSIPLQMFVFFWTFGMDVLRYAAMGLAFFPLVYLGAAIGIPIGNRIEKKQLRQIAYMILLAIGAGIVLPALFSWIV